MENNVPTTVQAQPQASVAPAIPLTSNRSLIKFILLNIVTLGIYSLVFYSCISNDINAIAGRYDGKKTMHYCLLAFILTPITLGIAPLVWFHKISARIGAELQRRGIEYNFSASTFWLWNILGSLIIVGPFIYTYKLIIATNRLAEDYNSKG